MKRIEAILATAGTGTATAGAELIHNVNEWMLVAVNALTLLWWVRLWWQNKEKTPKPPKLQK